MEVVIDRRYKKESYTISNLYIEGSWFCNALEDKDRGLKDSMGEWEIRKIKIYGETAIPSGRYRIDMDTVSPKYKGIKWYKDNFGGRMPRLIGVKGFEGILIHPGNTALDSLGCLIVGTNSQRGKVLDSRATFLKLWKILEEANKRGEEIWITIK